MASLDGTGAVGGLLAGQIVDRFIPEPKTTAGISFRGALSTVGSLAKSFMPAGLSGIDSPFSDLISQQMYWQTQMQLVSLYSNVEKSKHETQMAAIRNVRVG